MAIICHEWPVMQGTFAIICNYLSNRLHHVQLIVANAGLGRGDAFHNGEPVHCWQKIGWCFWCKWHAQQDPKY